MARPLKDWQIDATNPDNLSNKVLSEKETRSRLLTHARLINCEDQMLQLFAKYDKLLKNCTNEKERKDIGKIGAFQMYNLLGKGGDFFVDGQLVYSEKNEK